MVLKKLDFLLYILSLHSSFFRGMNFLAKFNGMHVTAMNAKVVSKKFSCMFRTVAKIFFYAFVCN